jgi:hypothetical protein
MQRLSLLFLVAAVATALPAQNSIVIPANTATTEGNSSNAFPWGRGGTGLRHQCVYDSSHFLTQGVNFPIQITGLRWRPNAGVALTASSYTAGCTVKLSTCPLDQASVSTNLASNQGADLTTVYSGVVSWAAQAAQTGPTPFGIVIPLQNPFVYDPNSGDLNIECDLPVQTFSGAGPQLDVQTTASLASRVYISTGYPGTGTGSIGLNHGVVVQVDFVPAGNGSYARSTPYGSGCYARYGSFYENFATSAAFDLANTAFTMIPAGGGYQVIQGITQFVPPSAAAQALTLTDDSEAIVALSAPFAHSTGVTTSLAVCSNGYVSVATGNGTGYTPTPSTTLAASQTGWWAQHDYNPTIVGSGAVKFEELGGIAYVTWDGVYDFGGTTAASANTFQFQFDLASGLVHVVFGSMSTSGNGRLVGYSPGGASADPTSMDISAALGLGFSVQPRDVLPLALATSARPIVGTTFSFNTSNIVSGTVLGATMLSFVQINPGIDLGFLGAPGCAQYLTPDVTQVFFAAGTTSSVPFAIPNFASYAGLRLLAQSAAFTPGFNALGVWTSNGMDLLIGTL